MGESIGWRVRALTVAAAALSSMVLVGCSDDTPKDLERCELKAMEIYRLSLSDYWDDPPKSYVYTCMSAAGYHTSQSCSGGNEVWLAQYVMCWCRQTWWEWLNQRTWWQWLSQQ